MSPDKIKAFLDDLARISLRHGVTPSCIVFCGKVDLPDHAMIEDPRKGLERKELAWAGMLSYRHGLLVDLDLGRLSNHEKLEIMGGRR